MRKRQDRNTRDNGMQFSCCLLPSAPASFCIKAPDTRHPILEVCNGYQIRGTENQTD